MIQTEKQKQRWEQLIKTASAQLYEHFDTFQILATADPPDDDEDFPRMFEDGVGNFLTRCRIIRLWADREFVRDSDVIDKIAEQMKDDFHAFTVVATNTKGNDKAIFVGGFGDIYSREQHAVVVSNSVTTGVEFDIEFEEEEDE